LIVSQDRNGTKLEDVRQCEFRRDYTISPTEYMRDCTDQSQRMPIEVGVHLLVAARSYFEPIGGG
jgi:hypothetical protein